MQRLFRSLLRPAREQLDRLLTSPWFIRYWAGAMDRRVRDNSAAPLFDDHDFVLLRKHYYLSIPDDRDLTFIRESELVGLTIDPQACFDFHTSHIAPFDPEFREFPHRATANLTDFHLLNGSFMAVDGNCYYGLIRSLAPKRIVEIGSGNSTRLAAHAIRRNVAEGRAKSELVAIEPFHSESLAALPEVTRIVQQYVQEVDLALFESLGENDILFIDSTHTVRPGGDVWWEFCEILPRIRPGVLIHVHDISLPDPYPAAYLKNYWYWMEQYMLQTFLAFNDQFEVLWPGHMLLKQFPDQMHARFGPEIAAMQSFIPTASAASLWMRRK